MAISGEGRAFELVRCETEADWLAERSRGIGGSDVAALMGLSRYKTPWQLWAEKRGVTDAPDLSGSQAVEWGSILEPVIGAHYRQAHPDREVRRVNAMARSLARPWAQASLDYEVRDPDLGWGVLEIKTVGLRRAADWDEGVPVYYQTQVAHYMSVTDRPFADVAVLVGGQEYREYRLLRDPDDEAAVARAVDAFWRDNVLGGVEPDVTGADSPSLFEAHPSGGEVVPEPSAAVPELAAWLSAREASERAKSALDEAAAALKARIGDAGGIETEEGTVRWQRSSRTSFDSRRFRAEHADMYDEYATTKTVDGGLRWSPRKGK